MASVVVRYKVKPERVQEHVALVKAVFEELDRTKPAGIRYAAVVAADGVQFTHIASISAPANPLAELESFRAFQRGIADRCEIAPAAEDVTIVGDYGLLA